MNREAQNSVDRRPCKITCRWNVFTGNADLIIGICLYATTAYLDAFYTIFGITTGSLQEGNPIPKYFMNILGIKEGLIFVKCSVCIFLVLVCGSIRDKQMACKYIRSLPFYIISFAQVLAAAAWLLCLNMHPLDILDIMP